MSFGLAAIFRFQGVRVLTPVVAEVKMIPLAALLNARHCEVPRDFHANTLVLYFSR